MELQWEDRITALHPCSLQHTRCYDAMSFVSREHLHYIWQTVTDLGFVFMTTMVLHSEPEGVPNHTKRWILHNHAVKLQYDDFLNIFHDIYAGIFPTKACNIFTFGNYLSCGGVRHFHARLPKHKQFPGKTSPPSRPHQSCYKLLLVQKQLPTAVASTGTMQGAFIVKHPHKICK